VTIGNLRQAASSDIEAMHRVRLAVRENRLASPISEADYVSEIEVTGRGWVIEADGSVVGFAVGNARSGNIWALFVAPEYQRRGYGRRLHDTMVAWLFGQGLTTLWLNTGRNTRAQFFYEAAGWTLERLEDSGEARYELRNPEHRGALPTLR
jgi:GNAT superfamily N-acetyltransferase